MWLLVFNPTVPNTREKAMATHSSTLAWKIPWTEEPSGLQAMGSLRVGHNRSVSAAAAAAIVNRAAVSTVVHVCLQIVVLSGCVPRSGGAGSHGSSSFSF